VLGEGRLLAADTPQVVLAKEDVLKMASITVPTIPRLFMRLQADGILPAGDFPVGFESAVQSLKEELDRRKKPQSQALSKDGKDGKDGDRVIQTQTLPKIEEIAGGPSFDADKTLVLKTPAAAPKAIQEGPAVPATDKIPETGKDTIASKLTL
jgi:hypothetical protein